MPELNYDQFPLPGMGHPWYQRDAHSTERFPSGEKVGSLADQYTPFDPEDHMADPDAATAMRFTQQAAVRDLPDASPVIRASASSVGDIMSSGEFRNQFATGKSNGSYEPTWRARLEARNHNIPNAWDGETDEEVDPSERPVYGYLEPAGGELTGGNLSRTEAYGNVAFHLKPSVLPRTTVTHGDSLSLEDAQPDTYRDVAAGRSRTYGDPNFSYDRHPAGKPDYYEAQYHGGVRRDDVHAARLYPGRHQEVGDGYPTALTNEERPRDWEMAKAAQSLKDAGIPWEARHRDKTVYTQGAMIMSGYEVPDTGWEPGLQKKEMPIEEPDGGHGQLRYGSPAFTAPIPYYTSERWTPGGGHRRVRPYDVPTTVTPYGVV